MIDATLELQSWDTVFTTSNERRPALAGVPQALVGSIADHSLIEAVRRALQATGYVELRNLGVRVNDYCVTFDGRVRSYHLKQLAQSAAARVPGIVRIVNAVEVVNEEGQASAPSGKVIRPLKSSNMRASMKSI